MNRIDESSCGCPSRTSTVRRDAKDRTLRVETVQIERKSFELALLKNKAGEYLRVTEDSPGRRSQIIIPAAGLSEFKRLLESFGQQPSSDRNQALVQANSEEAAQS